MAICLLKDQFARMIDTYHANKKDKGKASVLKWLKQKDGELRCIVSTVAFGTGIDIPDIYRIIIWGCPSTIDSFWQECGRDGRDGITRSITTMYALRNKRKHPDESMKELLQKAVKESVCETFYTQFLAPSRSGNGPLLMFLCVSLVARSVKVQEKVSLSYKKWKNLDCVSKRC